MAASVLHSHSDNNNQSLTESEFTLMIVVQAKAPPVHNVDGGYSGLVAVSERLCSVYKVHAYCSNNA